MIGEDVKAADFPEGVFPVPVDLVLRCASQAMLALISSRRQQGELPKQLAIVFIRDRRYFAIVDFHGPGRPGLFMPLDAWVWHDPRGAQP